MKLLTNAIRKKLPALYSQEQVEDPTVWVKFFTPDAAWTWYATEGSLVDTNGIMIQPGEDKVEVDFLFFGYVRGLESELGYLSLPFGCQYVTMSSSTWARLLRLSVEAGGKEVVATCRTLQRS
jgi:hypothetical protein